MNYTTIIKIAAIILLTLFYIIYLAKMLLLKNKNIKANILGKGQKPKGEAMFETVLRTVTFLGVPVKFFSIIWDNLIWSFPAFCAMRENGLIIMSLGLASFLLAVITMRNNWRAGYSYEQDTQLVITGIYRFSRNPAFVGFDLVYLGCALAFPNILNIIFAITAIILFHVQILGEEKFLVQKFGQSYLDYKNKVRRYI